MESSPSLPPITEDDIVEFLVHTPGFFERHASVLACVQLTSPHGQRAVSLQERQAEMLREKIRYLELRLAEMLRYGQENAAIVAHLQRWTAGLLQVQDDAAMPEAVAHGLRDEFQLPQVALRLWGLQARWSDGPYAQGVSDHAVAWAQSLKQPYCGGTDPDLEALQWLADPASVKSLALLPLRSGAAEPAFGLLLLGSDDAHRFDAQMGTEFLQRIAELAAASLRRLLP